MSPRRRLLLGLLGSLALVAGYAVWRVGGPPEPSTRAGGALARSRELPAESHQEHEEATPARPNASVASARTTPADDSQPGIGSSAELERATDSLEQVLRAQARNAAWTDEIVGGVLSVLDQPRYAGTLIDDVDCRESLCKMTLTHADAETQTEFWETDFLISGAWGMLSLGGPRRVRNGRPGSVLFFARKGDLRPFQQARRLGEETETNSETPPASEATP